MFEVRRTHARLAKNKCTHNVSPFAAAGDIIGLYFFENEAGQAATVNRYRDRITQFFLPKLDDIDVANMWFQDDVIANETIQLPHFLLVYSLSDQNWPPRSCDLTPLDFFLRGYLK